LDEDAATRRLLRSPPSEAALAWAAAAANGEVESWEVLRGGMSSAMYALNLVDGRGLVLRCLVQPDEDEPDPVEREAAALRAAAGVGVPTPLAVATDPNGDEAGVPAVLMTRLVGRVVWDPKDTRRWLAGLARVLPQIHEGDAAITGLGHFFTYQQRSFEPPKWATEPRVWERAVEIFHGPVLEAERCFIHRDFHPGNVLWHRGRITGVVDWESGCIGPPSVDISHCRSNLLGYAPDLAAEFTRLAETCLGRDFHPWADIASLIGTLDGLRRTPPSPAGRIAVERAIATAVSELGGA
jgi:aminoglycoside phosphotransferase (APT) family kinase protein